MMAVEADMNKILKRFSRNSLMGSGFFMCNPVRKIALYPLQDVT